MSAGTGDYNIIPGAKRFNKAPQHHNPPWQSGVGNIASIRVVLFSKSHNLCNLHLYGVLLGRTDPGDVWL